MTSCCLITIPDPSVTSSPPGVLEEYYVATVGDYPQLDSKVLDASDSMEHPTLRWPYLDFGYEIVEVLPSQLNHLRGLERGLRELNPAAKA